MDLPRSQHGTVTLVTKIPARILIVAPPVGPIGSGEGGGVETHLLNLLPILVGRRHHIGVLAPAGSLVPDGVTVYQVPGEAEPSATRSERTASTKVRTRGVLENMWEQALRLQSGYDVVASTNYDWLAFYLTPLFTTPVGHWITIGSAVDSVDQMIEKRWNQGALKLALYTAAQAKTYPFIEIDQVHLLYGGVDTDVFRYNPEPQDRLCWAARISPEKGLEDAVAAAQALHMPLDVCGKVQDPAYWQSVMDKARGMELVYHGFLMPVALQQRYAAARVTLVTPHWTEAFGNTVIESLACGTPVVAYNNGGPAEIIDDGVSGKLVTPGDIGALVEGVRRALTLDRRAALARARDFSFHSMADRFETWIDALRS